MIYDTPEQIKDFRLACLISAMRLYLNHGLLTHRAVTPARMREVATEYTGKKYKRSRVSLRQAYEDLLALKEVEGEPV